VPADVLQDIYENIREPLPRSAIRLPKGCRNLGFAFPTLLVPEFAGLWVGVRFFNSLQICVCKESSKAQLVNLTSSGQLPTFPILLHFAHGGMPGTVLRSDIIDPVTCQNGKGSFRATPSAAASGFAGLPCPP
jgi:hypothetical protein